MNSCSPHDKTTHPDQVEPAGWARSCSDSSQLTQRAHAAARPLGADAELFGHPGPKPFRFEQFENASSEHLGSSDKNIAQEPDNGRDQPLELSIVLGRTQLERRQLKDLRAGSVLQLKQTLEEPVELYANGVLFARGEVLLLHDMFCVRVTELEVDKTSHEIQ